MSTILLVEDNPHIMKINAEVLSLHGYEVLRAGTAAEAREQLRWHPANLIVLDIMLPDGNGIELCRELKGRYHTKWFSAAILPSPPAGPWARSPLRSP